MSEEAERMHRTQSDSQGPLPLTVTSESLICNGSDKKFRALIEDLLLLSGQIQWLRSVLARHLGVSEPQYRILMTIARLQDEMNVSVSALAARMRVTGAFVTAEAGKLHRMGLILKEKDQLDRRGVILRLSEKGHRALVDIAAGPQTINDELFKDFSKEEFKVLSTLVRRLVRNGERAERVARTLFHNAEEGAIREVG